MSNIYTVALDKNNTFNIINAETGSIMNRIITTGEVISGPIVVGDKCTFIIQSTPSQKSGVIYKLPNGTLINRYIV